jgi:serine/threonine-protein kinase
MLRPGAKFDRYTIDALLGEGGMASVYSAHDDRLRRAVALKLLRAVAQGPADRARANERLLREARAAAALSHANAVAIYDVGESEGTAFIAMELVEGRSLRALVGDPSVPMSTRVAILADVSRALSAAHERGLIHRDIKPENVMVRRDGAVKVLDFGLARDLGEVPAMRSGSEPPRGGAANSTVSRDGAMAGTPRYMAPEQLRGDPQDARTDQFSWGVMAYELATGRAPWGGDGPSLTLAVAIETEDPPPPREVNPDVPEALERVILRAIAKSPGDRFPSMEHVLAALGERPLSAAGRAPVARARRVALLGAVIALAVAGVSWTVRLRSRPPTPRAVTSAPVTAPAPTAVTDLPVPASQVPGARAEYLAGLQALRDGSVRPAVAAFERAAELDPSMAAAHLRIALWGQYSESGRAHAHFARASEQRALLSERDRSVLWMLEPWYLPREPDEATLTERVTELARRWPRDAELAVWAATREKDVRAEIAAYEAVLRIDPQFMFVYTRLANAHIVLGDYDGALAALNRCLALAPSASACLSGRISCYEELGRCDDMGDDARLLAATAPSARAFDWVARALLANGAPEEAVRGALELKWNAAKDDVGDAYRRADEAHLAILRGDFTRAEGLEREALGAVSGDPSEDDRAAVVVPLAELLIETGQTQAAGRLANDYLNQRKAWQSAAEWAPVPEMYAIAVHAGVRRDDERRAAVAEWTKLWDPIEGPLHLQVWELGYAVPAETAAEATAALALAPSPLPRLHSNQFHREGLEANGRTLLLAGRTADAVAPLRLAAKACSVLQVPIEHMRASLHLGQALEGTGDVGGACAAYRVVLDRWGAARPRSATAERARERTRALACP